MITFGVSNRADFRASNFKTELAGTSYQLDAQERSFLVRLPLIGKFNIYNSLAALAAASALGIQLRAAVLALATAPAVPGGSNSCQPSGTTRCTWITRTRMMRCTMFCARCGS